MLNFLLAFLVINAPFLILSTAILGGSVVAVWVWHRWVRHLESWEPTS